MANQVAIKDQDPGAQFLSVLERAASDPNIDVDKMERLLNMQERVLTRNAEVAFNEAMNAAQSAVGRISADANNPQTRSKYASYAKLDSVLRPVYTSHGFSLSFDTGDAPREDMVRVVCYVSHKNGHTRNYHVDIDASGKGAKGGDVMTKTHATGSAMSYGSRYLLKLIFNVAIGEHDDDGNAAGSPADAALVTAEQSLKLEALADEVGADKKKFLSYMKVENFDQIRACDFNGATKALEKKRAAK